MTDEHRRDILQGRISETWREAGLSELPIDKAERRRAQIAQQLAPEYAELAVIVARLQPLRE